MPQLGEEVFVTPRPGLAVADAHGRPLQAGLVRWSENWQRRLEAGDVEVLSPAQVEEAPAPPAPQVELREDPGSGAPREGIEIKEGEVGVLIVENGEPPAEVIR